MSEEFRNKTEEKRGGKDYIPALQDVGGSFCKSLSSLRIRFEAINSSSTNVKSETPNTKEARNVQS